MRCATRLLVVILLIALGIPCSGSEGKSRTGTINLGLAASLHPRMSLFDFRNLGFFKVSLGLTKDEFQAAVARSAASAPLMELDKRLGELDRACADITHQKHILFQRLSSAGSESVSIRTQLQELDDRAGRLRNERNDTAFAIDHPELTLPDETRKLLDEIDREIMDIVREVAAAKGYDVVLNSTFPVPFGYPLTYRSGGEFGRGVSGLDQQILYALMANHDDSDRSKTLEEGFSLWLRLCGRPQVQRFLPLQPWPLVVHGGESMTAEVVRRLYERYRIFPETIEVLVSVVNEFETSTPPVPEAK